MTERDQNTPPVRQEAQEIGTTDQEVLQAVEEIEQHLRVIHRERYRVIEDDERRESLTAPQRQAMIILTQTTHADGMTVKELSEHMGLAQSTVSGIVDRLERKRLLHRHTISTDRRATRLEVSAEVKAYVQQRLPAHLQSPLLDAVQRASRAERSAILLGLTTLRRLLTEAQTEQKPQELARDVERSLAASEMDTSTHAPAHHPRPLLRAYRVHTLLCRG